MNIKFNVNETTYQLTSDKYQIILNEIKVIKSGKNKGQETTSLVGYFKDEFQALKSILGNEKYLSECSTFAELEKLTKDTLDRLNELCDLYDFKK